MELHSANYVPCGNCYSRYASNSALGKLDLHAATNWDKFYQQNKTNFFKDRHYLNREFPELSTGDLTTLEVCYMLLVESAISAVVGPAL